MGTKKEDPKEKVVAKVLFLKKVTNFAVSITDERGISLERTVHDHYVHSIRQLHNFGGFSFHANTGQTEFGGNHIKVWYHPHKPYSSICPDPVPVLDISWGTYIEQPIDIRFNDNPDWQCEILKVIRNQKSIARQIDWKTAQNAKKKLTQQEELQERKPLAGKARQLHIF